MTSSMALQSGASSSLSVTSRWAYDVFLSFRGEDVRNNFVSHLYAALRLKGINTYIDDKLERGERISPALLKAIEGSRISIIILSKNYASSTWCLDELKKILEYKETKQQIVLPVFYKVDPSVVRKQKSSYGEAMANHEHKLNDDHKRVERWTAALTEVANLSGLHLEKDGNESEFIHKIIQWVDSRIINRTELEVANYPIGIESRVQHISSLLCMEKNDIVHKVGIFGVGGIGKTTIAKAVYNKISSQFESSCFLKNIRETSKAEHGRVQLQEKLLSDILGAFTSCNIDCVDRGINVIKERLHTKRVLLILDDVDKREQLKDLACTEDCDWFGSGSRIIITTRNQCLLDNSKGDSKYKMTILDNNEALQLFSLHAFEGKEPPKDFMDISEQVIKYAQGLPLALTVLGSDLKGQSIPQWRSALDKYKNIPNGNIQEVLLVSYEGLNYTEKEIFLDIAFFFKGEPLANFMQIFDDRSSPLHGIKRLIDKCLITIEGSNEFVQMHDLLRDMGREIVRLESPKEPSKRSRLLFHEDIREVLEENTGPNKVEGILLDLPEGDEEIISLHPEAFRHMKRLRVFINRNARFSCAPNYLSNELRILDWSKCPLQSLPHHFQGKKLISLRMHDSLIKELGEGFKPKNLTTMTFEHCEFLKKIPDLSSTSNLEELIVRRCPGLVEVHDSVGSLENLLHLCFEGCSELRILPRSLNLRSLSWLVLSDCSSLRYFPEVESKMESLIELNLKRTAIEELPLSIGNLVGLQLLCLSNCRNLMRLPNIACILLQHLDILWIDGCPNLVKKKRDDGLSLVAIESAKMEEEITNFFPISSLFTMFNSSASLYHLDLSETEIVSLPTCIREFVGLNSLYLFDCEKLEEILELPPNIENVCVSGCKSLERFPEVSKILQFNGSHIRSLSWINLDGCDKMHVNIWNSKVQNPLLWKGLYQYDATLFLENHIADWFSYIHEFLKDNEMVKGPDDYVKPRGEEEWAIDIEGPHYLEEINGIVLYVVMFSNCFSSSWGVVGDVKITSNSSNHVCCIEGVKLINKCGGENETGYAVWVGYSNLQSFELKVLDNLRVQFDHNERSPMLCESSNRGTTGIGRSFYESFRAKVVYNNERRAM